MNISRFHIQVKQSVTVDFTNTATLTHIVIDGAGSGTQVLGHSGTVYSALVTSEIAAVPLPAALWMMLSAVGIMVGTRWR